MPICPATFARLLHRPGGRCGTCRGTANPGFGSRFTDHMVTIDWDEGAAGTRCGRPHGPIPLDPAASVLHLRAGNLRGLKAYRHSDGSMALFRPEANAARFNARPGAWPCPRSSKRCCLRDRGTGPRHAAWFHGRGRFAHSRPFMIATEASLGVRPAKQYKFVVIARPGGQLFQVGGPGGFDLGIGLYRAAPAAPVRRRRRQLCRQPGPHRRGRLCQGGNDQVLFLDAAEHKWIEELGGMNLFFVFADGSLLTPPLSGTILAGALPATA
ncbi:MAG: branched chain amino acid aminotransferase [Novosphingobium sp.]